MSDFKNLLTIKKHKEPVRKNILEVAVEMDANDGDDVEKTFELEPEKLFENEKLIYCLAYVSCSHDFKKEILEEDNNRPAFCTHIGNNYDIDELEKILAANGFMCSGWGDNYCHTMNYIDIIWYDEDCQAYDITFNDIIDQFKKMTYQEICDKINSIK